MAAGYVKYTRFDIPSQENEILWWIYRFYRMQINGLLLGGIEVVMWGALFLCAAR